MSGVAARSTAEGGTGSCARAVSRSRLGLCVPSRRHHGSLALAGEHNVCLIRTCLICKSAVNLHKHLMAAEFSCS